MEETARRHRLDRRLAKGRLAPRHVGAVARAISARRERAEPEEAALASGAGTPGALARRVQDLAAKLESHPQAELRAALGVLLAYQRRFLEDGEEALLDRLAERRIGALHGRLACDAVWVRGGRRVRFAPPAPAAWGDVAEDVARLTLELRARGGAGFAERLAAAHALAADDYGLYRVLGFYERDAACALALDGAGPAPRTWVEAALADAGRPRLVIAVGGGVASGKSRVAKAVAGRLAAPRVVAERVRAALHLPDPGEIAHELLWQPGIALRVHQGVFARAADVLASGRTVVLDASFESPARREAAAALAAQQGARFVFVHCEPPAAVVEARLRARDVRDGNTLFGWHSLAADFAARFEPPAPDEAGEVLRLDTALPDSGWKALVAPRLATWGMPLAREPEPGARGQAFD